MMIGYDGSLVSSFYAYPTFAEKYGHEVRSPLENTPFPRLGNRDDPMLLQWEKPWACPSTVMQQIDLVIDEL